MAEDNTGDTPLIVPVIQEEAFLEKRIVETENVRVRTSVDQEAVILHGTVSRDLIEVRRVTIDRQVDRMPDIREEDGVTIIPVIEERPVIEKRLFLVEEIHLVRSTSTETVKLPTTLRRTRVDVERHAATSNQEDPHGRT